MTTTGELEGVVGTLRAALVQAAEELQRLAGSLEPSRKLLKRIDEATERTTSLREELEETRRLLDRIEHNQRERKELTKLDSLVPGQGLLDFTSSKRSVARWWNTLALALLHGDLDLALRAVTVAASQAHIARACNALARVIPELASPTFATMRAIESTLNELRLTRGPERLAGVLELAYGRSLRELVESPQLADAAFERARTALGDDDPEPLVELAETARRGGRKHEAQTMVSLAVGRAPHRPVVWIELAVLAEDHDIRAAAVDHYTTAASLLLHERQPLEAARAIAPCQRCGLYTSVAQALYDATRLDEAIDSCDRGLSLASGMRQPEIELYRLRARIHEDSANPKAAAADYYESGRRLAANLDPSAVDELRKSLALDPTLYHARWQLADALRIAADGKARATLHEALEIWTSVAPNVAANDDALVTGALLLEAVYEFDNDRDRLWQAARHAEHALLLRGHSARNLALLGRTHRGLGYNRSALALTERAYKLGPTQPLVADEHLVALTNMGFTDDALAMIDKAPDSVWRRAVEAELLVRQNRDLPRARELLERALSVDPSDWMRMSLAEALWKSGEEERANEQYARVADTDQVTIWRAEALLWLARFEAAKQVARDVMKASPGDRPQAALTVVVAELGVGRIGSTAQEIEVALSGPGGEYKRDLARWLEKLRRIPQLGREASPRIAAELERVRSTLAASDLAPSIEQELNDDRARQTPASPACEIAIDLALARMETEAESFRAAAQRYRNVATLGAPEIAALGLERVDAGLERVLRERTRPGHVPASDELIDIEALSDVCMGDPVRMARWVARGGVFMAVNPETVADSLHGFELALQLANGDPSGFASDVPSWIYETAQAAVIRDHWCSLPQLAPHVHLIDAWIEERLGMTEPHYAVGAAPVAIVVPEHLESTIEAAMPRVRTAIQTVFGVEPPQILLRRETRDDCVVLIWEIPVANVSLDSSERWLDAFGERLIEIVSSKLGDLIGLDQTASLVEEWRDASGGQQFVVRRIAHIPRFYRHVSDLLEERTSLVEWKPLVDVLVQHHKRPHEELHAMLRAAIRHRLYGVKAHIDGAAVQSLPPQLERTIASYVRRWRGREFFAAHPKQLGSLAKEIRNSIKPDTRVLVTANATIRPWLRRLLVHDHLDLAVVTQEELAAVKTVPTAVAVGVAAVTVAPSPSP